MVYIKTWILLILSQLFSVIGTVIIQFALSLYILDLTGSALTFSVITSLAVVGRLVMLPFCGILADRMNKRLVMILMDSAYLGVTILMALAVGANNRILFIGGLTCIMGMVSAFETPIAQSTIPLISNADDLPKITSIVNGIGILGNLFGPILAGAIYQQNAMQFIFLLCGLFFILAIGLEYFLHFKELPVKNKFVSIQQVIKADTLEITAYLKRQIAIFQIYLLIFLLNLFLSSFIQVVIPYLARIKLAVSNQQFGLMNAFFALGGLLGSILYGVLSKKIHPASIPQQLVIIGLLFLTLALPLGWFTQRAISFNFMTGLVAILLALVTMVSVQLIVFIQITAEPQLLGRLMSFVMIAGTLATPLGQILFGWLSNTLTNTQMIYLVGAISTITIMLAKFSWQIFDHPTDNKKTKPR
ncbi:hypothetical protein AYR54_07500 [Loigolactobacillus backii]|uniref:Uncharacterized protein n=1 Tax=Loigolactobacillus backii TaxID=375175 RepID=A0A192H248_9LACO|nr:MFS transporter [Loigolactobacillus backii]ANK60204.1 hypothetical protein AYR52_08090 [Loigolactobacillus backii]ANK62353.1 hypothetical protein AYR53_05895 [Loigolactobacillus backii]ANK65086.1 hypothetical protein AYR54_07500 [Loigolactobacillus backii]ANK67645.1 hypothetical protein AYR55_08105 [Loigolactobacillus backii]ANK70635.1 hypothetical protein AYR56_11095 [Loigolactobacillus backii]